MKRKIRKRSEILHFENIFLAKIFAEYAPCIIKIWSFLTIFFHKLSRNFCIFFRNFRISIPRKFRIFSLNILKRNFQIFREWTNCEKNAKFSRKDIYTLETLVLTPSHKNKFVAWMKSDIAHCKPRCARSHTNIEQFFTISPFNLNLATSALHLWNEYAEGYKKSEFVR